MIRAVTLLGLLSAVSACKSTPANPWTRKTWDEASLRAWSEECAGSKRTVRDDSHGILSFTTSYESNDPRLEVASCDISFSKSKRRLLSVDVVVWHTKAIIYPDEYKLNYTKQLALILPLVPPDVATVVRTLAPGRAQRVVKGPFTIDVGFDSLDRWHLKLQLTSD